jgi:hypothetical protein
MNSPSNEPVREWLMKYTNLVSAVRLPNNLMSDNAGTEVGSDLIILQKNNSKLFPTPEEQAFLKSRTLSNGISINNYFQDFSHVVHTKGYPDKDLYGSPGMIFIHEGGIPAMAKDLKNMLSDDFSKHLDKKLYLDNSISMQSKVHAITPKEENKPQQSQQTAPNVEQKPLLTLYDLFGFSEEERKQLNTKKKGKRKPVSIQRKPVQLNLFSQQSNTKSNENTPAALPVEETVLEHYREIKEKHRNALLLLREGNRYRAFGEDAGHIAKILGTALVKVSGTDETGFPASALDTNLPQLVRARSSSQRAPG